MKIKKEQVSFSDIEYYRGVLCTLAIIYHEHHYPDVYNNIVDQNGGFDFLINLANENDMDQFDVAHLKEMKSNVH